MTSIINYIKAINLSQQVTSFLLGKSQQQATIIEKKNEIITTLLKKDDAIRDLNNKLSSIAQNNPDVMEAMENFNKFVDEIDSSVNKTIKEAYDSEKRLQDDCLKFEDKHLS